MNTVLEWVPERAGQGTGLVISLPGEYSPRHLILKTMGSYRCSVRYILIGCKQTLSQIYPSGSHGGTICKIEMAFLIRKFNTFRKAMGAMKDVGVGARGGYIHEMRGGVGVHILTQSTSSCCSNGGAYIKSFTPA